MAGKVVVWVDNSRGSDDYDGLSEQNAVATINGAIAVYLTYGGPGSTIRICNTGIDYTHANWRTYLNTGVCAGYGWGEDERCTIEGYDPSGGNNYPTLLAKAWEADYCFKIGIDANYWLIQNLRFLRTHPQAQYGGGFIYWSSNLHDQHTHFKVRYCIFEGQYTTENYERALYNYNGTLMHLDVQYCLFKNIKYFHFAATGSPYPVQFVIRRNIFWNQYKQQESTIRMNANDPCDFTFEYNTFINNYTSRYAGYPFYLQLGGNFQHRADSIKMRGNYIFSMNYGFLSDASQNFIVGNQEYVGYNTLGDFNGASQYRGDMDYFQTAGDVAIGDYEISDHAISDQTEIFKAMNDFTYLWPETGWIMAPDVRPIGWEMTGTWEDATAGLRGAINHSGIYRDDTAFDTSHCVVIKDRTSILETSHQVFIDRTEYFTGTGSLMFWDSSDVSEVSDTTTIEYAYDKEPGSTYGVLPKQSGGTLQITRQAPVSYGGVKGKVYIDLTSLDGFYSSTLGVYLDNSNGIVGPVHLGNINFTKGLVNSFQKLYNVPEDLMLELSNSSFVDTKLKLDNSTGFTATWGILDSYMTFLATSDSTIDSSHSVVVADATTPIIWRAISTSHKVNITGGQLYPIDYYIPGDWWGFSEKKRYTYEDWNNYETIVQYFGRFFHSPLYYGTQLPDFGTIKLLLKANGTIHVIEDYPGASVPTQVVKQKRHRTTNGISVVPWVSNILNLYAPVVAPDLVEQAGAVIRLEPFIEDNTVGITFRETALGIYDFWDKPSSHPFNTDQYIYLSFYGKKE